uniref:RRM domain-containing protein n=1 Tax=Rhinopithecus bieti TaxID=61621 RepID=A0A2K6JW12_RHIBE
ITDDTDVEAMLEVPYKKAENQLSRANGHEERKKSKSRSRSRERKRSKSKERKERKKSKSHERSRSRSRDRRFRGRYRSPYSGPKFNRKIRLPHSIKLSRRRFRSKSPFRKDKSPVREPVDNLTPEERDARIVFCMQLAAGIRPKDLEEFFSTVGKARDVRMISDRNSRRSKGITYVEFVDVSSVPLAIGLTGQRVLGVPKKNRAAAMANNIQKGSAGPKRLYVDSLHFNITEDTLRGILEPFGRIESIQLMINSETGQSKGYGFITFSDSESGRPMKVGHVTEHADASSTSSFLDSDKLEGTRIDLGTTGRLQLMARLAEDTGLQIPPAAQQALQMSGSLAFDLQTRLSQQTEASTLAAAASVQPLATQCFQLSNMFNPQTEEVGWDTEIKDDVIEECFSHRARPNHIYVDKNSAQGNVYVKCPSIATTIAAVNALHGRWFAGKMITAAYVPLPTYYNLFPDSMTATQLLVPSRR